MSRGLNKITIIGHAGRDPEMRYTPGGSPVTEFSVAVSNRRKQPDGSYQEETTWFKCVFWNRLAEIADQYAKKGARVYVEGRLQIREYTDRDNNKRTSVEIVASDLILLSGRDEGGTPQREPVRAGAGDDYDDLPF